MLTVNIIVHDLGISILELYLISPGILEDAVSNLLEMPLTTTNSQRSVLFKKPPAYCYIHHQCFSRTPSPHETPNPYENNAE